MKINAGFSPPNAFDHISGKKRGATPPSRGTAHRAGDVSARQEFTASEKLKIAPVIGAGASEYETDGLSRVQTALSGFKSAHTVLNRMLYLAAEAAKPSAGLDLPAAKNEFVSLKAELDGIALSAAYHEKQENGFDGAWKFESGPAAAEALGVDSLGIGKSSEASVAVSGIENAISTITAKIRSLEEIQERMEKRLPSVNGSEPDSEKVTSMESAKHFSVKVNVMVLKYRRHAMMAQANAAPQRVLSLIGR